MHVRNQLTELEKRINQLEKSDKNSNINEWETELEEVYRRLRRLELIVKPPQRRSAAV